MDFINSLINTYNIPILTAFLLGILTSISPCPLATNITAVAFISKDIKSTKNTFLKGLSYTLGRAISYTTLAFLIFFGLSTFQISKILQGYGQILLGPILIIIGLFLLNVIKLNLKGSNKRIQKLQEQLSKKGYIGALLLGVLFALAFCPYSGVLFFGILIPLILSSKESVLLAPIFAIGTSIPVIIFSILLAFSFQKVSKAFKIVQKVEKILRIVVGLAFLVSGIYYLRALITFLTNL